MKGDSVHSFNPMWVEAISFHSCTNKWVTSYWEKCNSRRIGKVSPAVATPVDIYLGFGSKVRATELSDWIKSESHGALRLEKVVAKQIEQKHRERKFSDTIDRPLAATSAKGKGIGKFSKQMMEIVSNEWSSKSSVLREKKASKGTSLSGKISQLVCLSTARKADCTKGRACEHGHPAECEQFHR